MKNVALFIDHENINMGLKSKVELTEYSRDVKYSLAKIYTILAKKIDNYRIVVCKYYAPYNPHTNEKPYELGAEHIYIPKLSGKSMADPMWICDIMETLYEKAIDVFVIVSADKDMIPLLRKLAAKNKEIYVITGSSDNTTVSGDLTVECGRLKITLIDYEYPNNTNEV